MIQIVADLGNSRLKWGAVDEHGNLGATVALPTDDPEAWSAALAGWASEGAGTCWAISSVNPPVADRLGAFLRDRGIAEDQVRWFRSAAEVPVRHRLEHPETAGADRALAVLAAGRTDRDRAGLVVSCGTAITVERVGPGPVWEGGAILPGLGTAARALHQLTAQLPMVRVDEAPPAWGRSTGPAMVAGLFWGTVGGLRELLARQSADLVAPWLVWTGGDAALLAPHVRRDDARIVPDLVLIGLANAGFGVQAR